MTEHLQAQCGGYRGRQSRTDYIAVGVLATDQQIAPPKGRAWFGKVASGNRLEPSENFPL